MQAYRYDVVGFAQNVLGIWLHPDQRRILTETIVFDPKTSRFQYHYVHVSAGNRFGKSVILAVIHLFVATFKHNLWLPGTHPNNPFWDIYDWFEYPFAIINLAPLTELAGIVRDKVHLILQGTSEEQLKNPNGRGKLMDGYVDLFVPDSEGKLLRVMDGDTDYRGFQTVHHVRMEYRTTDDNAKAVQGSNFFLITIDEAGRQRKSFVDLVGPHIQPRIMDTPGVIIDVTTPDKDTNNDYQDWHVLGLAEIDEDGVVTENTQRNPDHVSVYGSTVEYDELKNPQTFDELRKIGRIINPFITWDMIEKVVSGNSPYLWPQILKGKFIQSEEAFFNAKSIAQCRTFDTHEARRRAGHDYAIGVDLAVAKAGDYSIFAVFDITQAPWQVVYYKRKPRGTPHPQLISDMKKLIEYYDGEWQSPEGRKRCRAEMVYDATGMGGKMFMHDMRSIKPRPRPFDYAGNGSKKLQLLKSLGITLDKGLIRIPAEFKDVFQELRQYKKADDKLATDAVMAFALANSWAETRAPQDKIPKKKVHWSIY